MYTLITGVVLTIETLSEAQICNACHLCATPG